MSVQSLVFPVVTCSPHQATYRSVSGRFERVIVVLHACHVFPTLDLQETEVTCSLHVDRLLRLWQVEEGVEGTGFAK